MIGDDYNGCFYELKLLSAAVAASLGSVSFDVGACFGRGGVAAFSSAEYICSDNLGLLPVSSPVAGFPNSTFWTGYPGTCN